MNVLLNVTETELQKISGDMSFYRDLLAADRGGPCTYSLVDRRAALLRKARKGLERAVGAMPASAIRRRLFRVARSYPIAPTPRQPKSDVILSHISFPALLPLPRRSAPPIIWSSQGLSPPDYYDAVGPVSYGDVVALYEALSKRAAMLLVWTESGAERLRAEARLAAPITVLPPVLPVAISPPPLTREARVHVLFVGRDARRKGLYELITACEGLGRERGDWALDVVSAPPADLAARIEALGNATLHRGPTDESVTQLMERADILVLPTRAETYGYVLIEAMVRGSALITSDAPPMNELVQDGVNGAVVPAGDADALAECLRAMLADEDRLAAMKEASRKRYEQDFAPERVLPRYHELFRNAARKCR